MNVVCFENTLIRGSVRKSYSDNIKIEQTYSAQQEQVGSVETIL